MNKDKSVHNLFHLPTLLLIIGYPVFWLELYFLNSGSANCSPLAMVLFMITVFALCLRSLSTIKKHFREFIHKLMDLSLTNKCIYGFGFFIALIILAVGLWASTYPPHLIQETDALMYHITLPRQHLLRGSFVHIGWSMADLYLLPIQFALSPYWLLTELPNKMPQFVFFLGLLAIIYRLSHFFGAGKLKVQLLSVLMVLGSHHISIQLGTAMLDVLLCYLVLAALDSFLAKRYVLSGIELSFYLWSKSFLPVQVMVIIFLIGAIISFLKWRGIDTLVWMDTINVEKIGKKYKRFVLSVLVGSLCIGGPFLVKNMYYAGTPLYPFFPGMINVSEYVDNETVQWKSIVERSKQVVATKDQYGSGRSIKDFVSHFWLIAIPEKGVNNRYDYPVGLIYLLCLIPFIFILIGHFKSKRVPLIPLCVVCYWATWWMGSHQTRFLIIPVVFMILTVASQKKFLTLLFKLCVVLALTIECISVVRAHKSTFLMSQYESLREKDKELLEYSLSPGKDHRIVNFPDVAYADYLVEVKNSGSVYTFEED